MIDLFSSTIYAKFGFSQLLEAAKILSGCREEEEQERVLFPLNPKIIARSQKMPLQSFQDLLFPPFFPPKNFNL